MKKILIIFSIVSIVAGVGCKKGYLDINTNPNSPTSASPELVLPAALNATAGGQVTNFIFISGWMGQWAISGSYAPSNNDFTTYKQTTDFGGGLWANLYDNLSDYAYVEQKGVAQNKPFYIGAAKIMKAYVFEQLVDMFGNIPYSDALKGTTVIQPKYDNASAIYDSLIANLDAAAILMERADAIAPSSSDILFSGNGIKWAQFANSLRLRILLRQVNVASKASFIQSELTKLNADPNGFLTVDAGVNPGYTNSTGKMSPFYGFAYNTGGTYIQDLYRANQFSILFLKNHNDPRLKLIYGGTPSNPAVYQGNYIGQQTGAFVGSASSIFGPGVLKSFSQPSILMGAAESWFLQAEAIQRGWLTGNAQTAFQNGITASFSFLGVPSAAAAAATYYGQSDAETNFATATNKIAVIMRQKWMAENCVSPFEEWADYRRLGLPADIPLTQNPAVDVLAIPVRIIYPTVEYQTNSTNVAGQGTVNQHTSKLFWMP